MPFVATAPRRPPFDAAADYRLERAITDLGRPFKRGAIIGASLVAPRVLRDLYVAGATHMVPTPPPALPPEVAAVLFPSAPGAVDQGSPAQTESRSSPATPYRGQQSNRRSRRNH